MKKQKRGRKLSLKRDQRKALLKSLITAFFLKEKIKTTEAKAKEISGKIEKIITKAKKENLASRRLLNKFLADKIVKKIITEITPRYKEKREGGYTRVIKLGPRKSDGAKMAIIELVK
jgi:large subunit ribosomal protein L17